jgi:hypothetical protein
MAVIAVTVVCALACRSLWLAVLAAYHRSKAVYCFVSSDGGCIAYARDGRAMTSAEVKASPRHRDLARTYGMAAAWPWLPVDPDSPDPEWDVGRLPSE